MGKYSVGYHVPQSGHDLQGITTLTHDPIAQDNAKPRRIIQGTTSISNYKYNPKKIKSLGI